VGGDEGEGEGEREREGEGERERGGGLPNPAVVREDMAALRLKHVSPLFNGSVKSVTHVHTCTCVYIVHVTLLPRGLSDQSQ